MIPLKRLARRSQRPATNTPPERLGGADAGPGALSTLELPTPRVVDTVDPLSCDRFTVDAEDWVDHAADWEAAAGPAPAAGAEGPPEPAEAERAASASGRASLLRLALVVVASCVAFHHSIASLARTISTGSALVYVAAVPPFAALALAAVVRRSRPRPVPRTRVGDLALGVGLCSLALVGTTLVGPGLSAVYFIWRLDLLGLWVFLLGAGVVAFGVGRVARSWPFWIVLALVWPFPLRLVNATAGTAVGGAVALTLVVLAVLAYGHRAGDPARRHVLVSAVVPAVILLATSGIAAHPPRILWPAVSAALVGAVWWRARPRPAVQRLVGERRAGASIPVLLALTVVGLVVLPAAPQPAAVSVPTGITSLALGPLEPPGWATMSSEELPEQRFFGVQSNWRRLELREGIAGVGPFIGGRDIVVDVVSTPRPQALALYPVVATYPMGTLSATPDAVVGLGHGVEGQLFSAQDPGSGVRYTLLTFSWRLPVDLSMVVPYAGSPVPATQRITLIALDDPDPDVAFPLPGNPTLDGVGAALATHGTGRAGRASELESVDAADGKLLVDTALRLVDQRLTGG